MIELDLGQFGQRRNIGDKLKFTEGAQFAQDVQRLVGFLE
jgi:hypothetical protein